MRIKLLEGKQKELILKAKGNSSWKEFAQSISQNKDYIAKDLKNEKILLSKNLYDQLCQCANKNFDKYIIKRYPDNWGGIKGGRNSPGSLINISIPDKNEKLAEFIGALLGDGNICHYKKGKKVGVYQIKIAGDYLLDKDYHTKYLKRLCKVLFKLDAKEIIMSEKHGRFLSLSSKKLVEFLIGEGFKAGDKIKNQVTIPSWIWNDRNCLRACVRGLIDTDGSIFQMSKRDSNLIRISFTNYNKRLLNDTRNAFIALGFSPTKLIQNKRFFVSKQSEIRKYLKEVGFSNKKHRDRSYKFFHSPVV